MDVFEPINNITLEKYAELTALMVDVRGDVDQCALIAEANGVPRADWLAAQSGWLTRMSDMALLGKVALAFMPLYEAAVNHQRDSQRRFTGV